jgi:hypothetical protein
MPEPRSWSPQKRQRMVRDDDDLFPNQSASDVGITELSERTRLSQPSHSVGSSPKRATSPVRDLLNDLRVSKPAVLCEIPSAIMLPERALALQRSLMDRLEEELIPMGLKVMISCQPKWSAETADKESSTASNFRNVSFCSGEHPDLCIRRLRYAISTRTQYTMGLCRGDFE